MFLRDLKKFKNYAWFSALSELKGQVNGSFLGYLWWILDPLLYVLIYSFIVNVVFKNGQDNIELFVFIGITSWNFFSSSISGAVGCIKSYSSITKKIFIPKCIIVLNVVIISFIKFLFGLAVSIICLFLFGIQFSFHIFEIIPLIIVYFIFTYGCSLYFAFIGVYIKDFKNLTNALLRLLMYLSCPFYQITRFPENIQKIYHYVMPTGFFSYEFRNAIMYKTSINFNILLYWLIISIVILAFGIKLVYKNENDYMKVE